MGRLFHHLAETARRAWPPLARFMTAALVSIALAPPAAIATGSSPPHHSRHTVAPAGATDRAARDQRTARPHGDRSRGTSPLRRRAAHGPRRDRGSRRRAAIGELGPVDRPGGLAYATHAKTLFVAESSGTVVLFHPGDHAPTHCVTLPGGAGIVRYDAAAERIFVGGGRGIAILDATTGDSLGTIPLASRPEDFEIEPSGPRLFVNLPSAGRIAVVTGTSAPSCAPGISVAPTTTARWRSIPSASACGWRAACRRGCACSPRIPARRSRPR